MARGYNAVTLIGNLGAEPKMHSFDSGVLKAELRLATTENIKRGGEYQDVTEWHTVVVWGKQAEWCQGIRTGTRVVVFGRITTRSWDDQEGKKQYKTEIVARDVFMDRAPGGPASSGGGNQHSDDDIPF